MITILIYISCSLFLESHMKPMVVALAGYPNCGKTSLFNALTGLHHHVGNWAGVTVESKRGQVQIDHQAFELVDLPGCYALTSLTDNTPLDESISQHFLLSGQASLILNVIDASDISRQLVFTLELLDQGMPLIVVLNMIEAAEKQGKKIDCEALSKALGCPVIPLITAEKKGLKALKSTLLKQPLVNVKTGCATKAPILQTKTQEFTTKALKIASSVSYEIPSCQRNKQQSFSFLLDKFVLHPLLGLPLLLSLMYVAFAFTINIGGGIQDIFIRVLQSILLDSPTAILAAIKAPDYVTTFVIQGLGQGLHTTLSFVPVIAVMFLCLAFLEASGYMARAALVMDKIMGWVGLSGKSFIPMILGFGCNVPAVLATRSLECRRERILTILMSPFMSCGARLAIYALFVTSFFKEGGQNIIFCLYFIGILIALLTGWVLRHTLLIGNKAPLKMELPPYRWPHFKMLVKTTWYRTFSFVWKAGMIIVPLCILFGILGAFKIGEETWLTFLGRSVTPIFSPMGIQSDNWAATVGLITGVVAKEVVVGTLNALYTTGNGVGSLVEHFGNGKVAFAYLLFVLLYFPCVSVLATIARELNLAWAVFTAVWTTSIAYSVSVLFYQCATFSEHPWGCLVWITSIALGWVLAWGGLRFWGRLYSKNTRKPLPTQILILS